MHLLFMFRPDLTKQPAEPGKEKVRRPPKNVAASQEPWPQPASARRGAWGHHSPKQASLAGIASPPPTPDGTEQRLPPGSAFYCLNRRDIICDSDTGGGTEGRAAARRVWLGVKDGEVEWRRRLAAAEWIQSGQAAWRVGQVCVIGDQSRPFSTTAGTIPARGGRVVGTDTSSEDPHLQSVRLATAGGRSVATGRRPA